MHLFATAASGARIPAIGFGTYGMGRSDMLRMIPAALRAGFRHIDTAQIYRNEGEVGEGIAASGVARSEIFVTTKVWPGNYAPSRFSASIDESLTKLRSDYVDLLLLHWPDSTVPLAEQMGALNEIVKAGKARHIGVSNFNRALLQDAVRLSTAPLATNQIELHPFLDQRKIMAATRAAGLTVTGYCAMAVGRVFANDQLREIAARHGRSVSQIVLRWLVQQDGVATLSRTTRVERLAENFGIFDFVLDEGDMLTISAMARPGTRIVDPPGLAPMWDT